MIFRIYSKYVPECLKHESRDIQEAVSPLFYGEVTSFFLAFLGDTYCADAISNNPNIALLARLEYDHSDPENFEYFPDGWESGECSTVLPGVELTDFSSTDGQAKLLKFVLNFNPSVRLFDFGF